MTNSDIFWIALSLVIYSTLNVNAYRGRTHKRWDDENPLVGYIFGLLVAGPMFLANVPKSLAPIGGLLFFGTIVHVLYCWIECWPSSIKRRDAEERALYEAERERQQAQWQAEKQKSDAAAHALALRRQEDRQQAELAGKRASLQSIIVGRDGVTNIAKRIIAELARANT